MRPNLNFQTELNLEIRGVLCLSLIYFKVYKKFKNYTKLDGKTTSFKQTC
jgi:hypothetical protein